MTGCDSKDIIYVMFVLYCVMWVLWVGQLIDEWQWNRKTRHITEKGDPR